jgi:hypothetical protein
MRPRTTFEIPGWGETQRRSDRQAEAVRKEVHGPTYQMLDSDQRQTGDPVYAQVRQIALREPFGFQHPQPLDEGTLQPGGPRTLPVSGQITHGPSGRRLSAFEREVIALGALHGLLGYRDRRFSGRRYRPTDNVQDRDGPQVPPNSQGWQRDLPAERYAGYGWLGRDKEI